MATIDIVYPNASRASNGIGDHTHTLARRLTERGHEVRVLSMGEREAAALPTSVNAWPNGRLTDFSALVRLVAQRTPNLLIVQFEQFSYGVRGFNPWLASALRKVRQASPHTGVTTVVHETYVMPTDSRRLVMHVYQKAQLKRLLDQTDHTVVTCFEWSSRLQKHGFDSEVLPVPSSIPRARIRGSDARRALHLGDGPWMAVFGHIDTFRESAIRAALSHQALAGVGLLYIGKDADIARQSMAGFANPLVVIEGGDAEAVAHGLAAADFAFAPFADGASARRSSLSTVLESGLACVTNRGPHTDTYLLQLRDRGALHVADSQDINHLARLTADLASSARSREAMAAALEKSRALLPTWEAVAAGVLRGLKHSR